MRVNTVKIFLSIFVGLGFVRVFNLFFFNLRLSSDFHRLVLTGQSLRMVLFLVLGDVGEPCCVFSGPLTSRAADVETCLRLTVFVMPP